MHAPRRGAAGLVVVGLVGALLRPAGAAEDSWTGTDKALHFGISTALAAGSYGLGVALWPEPDERWKAALLSTGVTLGAGGAKELADLAGLGNPSWKDFTWDVIGLAVGLGLAFTFDLALRGWAPDRGAGAGVALGGRF